ncbi:MAG: hypothetical protein JNM89_01325 [Hyphomicrobiaceae bacterium]|nr:hypothetical protein [Hyphomicrobiaceae bacterium]
MEIHAPIEAVMERLVPTKEKTFAFNMHKLFPENIPADDPTGNKTWNYDWFVDNTGSKWAPEVMVSEGDDDLTFLNYDSAWTPNNGTLERLHEMTGWTICNDYREEGMQFAGRFTCDGRNCRDEELEYLTICEICEEEKPEDEYDEELDGLICNECRAKAKLIS